MLESRKIRDGGILAYDEAFLGPAEADALFDRLLTETPWQQERGRMGSFPRLTAWYADQGMLYTYSGVTHHAIAWTPTLADVRKRVETVSGTSFNSVLLNYYRDGRDSMGYHADAEPELGQNPVIASISVGGVRAFHLKHGTTGEKMVYSLAHGSVLLMGGTSQHFWTHGVPKTKSPVAPRINLTFRQIARKG